MGCRLCQKSVFFDIYERCWYLCTMLVFTSDAGIYAGCWYLRSMLVFMSDAGIYALKCWYLQKLTGIYKLFILVFTNDTGIYEN